MGWRFTTSYHTRFPEYLKKLARIPEGITYKFLRWFHGRSSCMMVATPSLEAELKGRGFAAPIRRWSRGVDLGTFRPRPKTSIEFQPAGAPLSYPRPVLLYVGRISHEKGIGDFLKLKTAGTKLVVGDGPARAELERTYRDAVFLGYRRGDPLGEAYAAADRPEDRAARCRSAALALANAIQQAAAAGDAERVVELTSLFCDLVRDGLVPTITDGLQVIPPESPSAKKLREVRGLAVGDVTKVKAVVPAGESAKQLDKVAEMLQK